MRVSTYLVVYHDGMGILFPAAWRVHPKPGFGVDVYDLSEAFSGSRDDALALQRAGELEAYRV